MVYDSGRQLLSYPAAPFKFRQTNSTKPEEINFFSTMFSCISCPELTPILRILDCLSFFFIYLSCFSSSSLFSYLSLLSPSYFILDFPFSLFFHLSFIFTSFLLIFLFVLALYFLFYTSSSSFSIFFNLCSLFPSYFLVPLFPYFPTCSVFSLFIFLISPISLSLSLLSH